MSTCPFIKNPNISEKEQYHIFGYIDPVTDYVESTKIPLKEAETWNTKNGITHFDVFGYSLTGLEFTWRYAGGRFVEWYSEPNQNLRNRVDDHLYNRFSLKQIIHVW